MNFNRVAAVVATAFAVSLPFSLLACSESNPTNFDEPIAYSEPAPESSSALESSSSGEPSGTGCLAVLGTVNDECLPACNDENEGKVETVWVGNPKYGYDTFHKCQNGSWVKGDISLTCDTAGVAVGDTCKTYGSQDLFKSGFNPTSPEYVFVYAGDGVWTKVETENDSASVSKIGDVRSSVYTPVDPHGLNLGYSEWTCFINTEEGWDKIAFFIGSNEMTDACDDYAAIYKACNVTHPAVGDTCSFEFDGKMHYYAAVKAKDGELNQWKECGYDSALGYCSEADEEKYRELNGKNYYCRYTEWIEVNLVPRQFTDSRKEGLTDEEFDVLDLPKDAKVGDRVGGLLEECWYNDELGVGGASLCPDIGEWKFAGYSYCMPRNYYRYRENGSWTVETSEERENDPQFHAGELCTAEREGVETVFPPAPHDPGRIYKCTSGCDILEGYIFGRTEQKNLNKLLQVIGIQFIKEKFGILVQKKGVDDDEF